MVFNFILMKEIIVLEVINLDYCYEGVKEVSSCREVS